MGTKGAEWDPEGRRPPHSFITQPALPDILLGAQGKNQTWQTVGTCSRGVTGIVRM